MGSPVEEENEEPKAINVNMPSMIALRHVAFGAADSLPRAAAARWQETTTPQGSELRCRERRTAGRTVAVRQLTAAPVDGLARYHRILPKSKNGIALTKKTTE